MSKAERKELKQIRKAAVVISLKEDMPKKPWYILEPSSPYVGIRDLFVGVALIGVLLVIPFELAFVNSPSVPNPSDTLFIFNRVIDGIFWLEMLTQPFVAFPKTVIGDVDEANDQASDFLQKSADMEYRLWAITKQYVKGWLSIDVLSSVPSAIDIYTCVDGLKNAALEESEDTPDGELSILAVTRTLKLAKFTRVARVLKILRILRMSKMTALISEDSLLQRFIDAAAVTMAEHTRKMRILKLMTLMMLVAHEMACMLGLSAIFEDQKLNTWWGTHGYCWPDDVYELFPGELPQSRCVDQWQQYFICLHFSLSLIFGIPADPFLLEGPGVQYFAYTDSFQLHEHVVFVIVSIIGAMLGMYLTGAFVAVVAGESLSTSEQITRFAVRYKIPSKTRRQLQKYFFELEQLGATVPRTDLFERLSPKLHIKLLMDIHGSWLEGLPFISSLSYHMSGLPCATQLHDNGQLLLSFIAMGMQPSLCVARESPEPYRMYVMVKGYMSDIYSKQFLGEGTNFGILSMLLQTSSGVGFHSLRSIGFSQCIYLERNVLAEATERRPALVRPYRRLRVWAWYKLLKQHIRNKSMMRALSGSTRLASGKTLEGEARLLA